MMHAYSFSENVRRVLAEARDVASSRRQEFVMPDDMFVALSRATKCSAVRVLQEMGVDVLGIAGKVEARKTVGIASRPTGPDLPYTTRAKTALELAMKEAGELQHSFVGTEHLLLGLISEGQSDAAKALLAAGATLERTRAAVADAALRREPDAPGIEIGVGRTSTASPLRSVTILVEHADGRLEAVRFDRIQDALQFLLKNAGS